MIKIYFVGLSDVTSKIVQIHNNTHEKQIKYLKIEITQLYIIQYKYYYKS